MPDKYVPCANLAHIWITRTGQQRAVDWNAVYELSAGAELDQESAAN